MCLPSFLHRKADGLFGRVGEAIVTLVEVPDGRRHAGWKILGESHWITRAGDQGGAADPAFDTVDDTAMQWLDVARPGHGAGGVSKDGSGL